MSQPLYGQRSDPYAAPECPRRPASSMGERPGQCTNPCRHLRNHWRVRGSVGR